MVQHIPLQLVKKLLEREKMSIAISNTQAGVVRQLFGMARHEPAA